MELYDSKECQSLKKQIEETDSIKKMKWRKKNENKTERFEPKGL